MIEGKLSAPARQSSFVTMLPSTAAGSPIGLLLPMHFEPHSRRRTALTAAMVPLTAGVDALEVPRTHALRLPVVPGDDAALEHRVRVLQLQGCLGVDGAQPPGVVYDAPEAVSWGAKAEGRLLREASRARLPKNCNDFRWVFSEELKSPNNSKIKEERNEKFCLHASYHDRTGKQFFFCGKQSVFFLFSWFLFFSKLFQHHIFF